MPYEIARNVGGCAYAVVKEGTETVVGCHDTRAKAGKHLAALRANVEDASKYWSLIPKEKADPDDSLAPIERILENAAFWEHFRERLEAAALPYFRRVYAAGMRTGDRVAARTKAAPRRRRSPDPALTLNDLAEAEILAYTRTWSGGISETTYNTVRDTVITARATGGTVEETIAKITPLFGRDRANRIAVTETTRLFGIGAQSTYRELGAQGWEWNTVQDPWVCPICQGNQDKEFAISVTFEPAHVSCRCFPSPVNELAILGAA